MRHLPTDLSQFHQQSLMFEDQLEALDEIDRCTTSHRH
jgi:hypothetical protein